MSSSHIDPPTLDCGKTVDELSDYLLADRTPRDPSIESCPECLAVLESLERLGALSRELVADDARALPAPPASWLSGIMDIVATEVRSGRDLPLQHPDPRVHLSVTEGAVRALLRSTADQIDGLVIGRTAILGEAETPGAPVEIDLSVSVRWDRPDFDPIDALRRNTIDALERHTELNVTAVNITVEDVHGWENARDSR
ncbi:Asp23/Gls24 family envelope stress response protein [Microbacterium sp. NPDC089189]|uniref:Asp23/Gls24 family envelope stress response protein n=1 Tax=Microbacterium sp. NPDC089189 TaxID=3154972 RepID=UPI00342939DA